MVPILLPKVWGGCRLAAFGKGVQPGDRIGESWEVADMAATSASGAGGGAVISTIARGPLAGRTLRDALMLWGDFLPADRRGSGGAFPLLIKFLDARENLSVQVHPNPAFVAAHPEAHLKTECWFVVAHEPGAVIYKGLRPGVDRSQIEEVVRTNPSGIVGLLEAVPAVVGECHNLPSGTVHALGAGVLVVEVQTASDTTFRVFDWGRTQRPLHAREALDCMEFAPASKALNMAKNPTSGGGGGGGGGGGDVLSTEFFRVWRVSTSDENDAPVGHGSGCFALTVIKGRGSLFSDDGEYEPQPLSTGLTVVVPAQVAHASCVVADQNSRIECLIAALPT